MTQGKEIKNKSHSEQFIVMIKGFAAVNCKQ